jgi:hypothetical protein
MKRFAGFLFVFALGLLTAGSARADIDQLCLKQCVAAGGGGSSCLGQCSYGAVAPKPKPLAAAPLASPHDVLPPLTPVGSAIVAAPKPAPAAPEKDYTCMTKCVSKGVAYGLCEKRCVQAVCAPTAVLCRSSVTAGAGR